MFGSDKTKSRKDTERSLISETVSIDGTVNSSGAIDVAGLIKGPVYSNEIIIKEIKGDIEFSNNLRTEDGADIEGYIKKSSSAGKKTDSTTGDFLFSKIKEDKKDRKNGKQASIVNKDSEALV